MFLVILRRSGPDYDLSKPLEEQPGWDEHAAFMDQLVDDGFILLGGPLSDEVRTAHAVKADSEDEVRATLARDPWSESHLVVDSIDAWTIRLAPDGLDIGQRTAYSLTTCEGPDMPAELFEARHASLQREFADVERVFS